MGEIADDLIDRMFDDDHGYFPNAGCFLPRGCNRGRSNKRASGGSTAPIGSFNQSKALDEQTRAAEFPSKKTDPSLLPNYPEKTFDMGFFPAMPVNKTPTPWELAEDEEPPF